MRRETRGRRCSAPGCAGPASELQCDLGELRGSAKPRVRRGARGARFEPTSADDSCALRTGEVQHLALFYPLLQT